MIYLNPTGVIGGAEMCLLDILAVLGPSRLEWSPRVVLGDDGPLRAEVEALGVPCSVLPMPDRLAALGDAGLGSGSRARLALAAKAPLAALAAAGYLARLRRALRNEAADLLQTNGMKAHVLGAWAAPRSMPVIWHLHDYISSRAVMARLLRLSARRRVRVVAVSRSAAADATRALGLRVPIEPIHNAVDLDRFTPGPGDGARLDELAGLPPALSGTVRVGLVAAYARWKGQEVFLDAAARLEPGLKARFFIVGGPLYKSAGSQYSRAELEARAEALGLGNRLGFVSHQGDPSSVYRALDVVVHASTRPEPFGRVIAEAMACGRPVLVAKAGGAAELFEDGVSALGCEPGNAAALASAISGLIGDRAQREALGQGGRAEAVKRFDRARLAEEWGRVYNQSLGRETATVRAGRRQGGAT